MQHFKNLRFSVKLWSAFAASVVFLLVVAGAGWRAMSGLSTALDSVTSESVPRLQHIAEISAGARQLRTRQYRYAVQTDAEKRAKLADDMTENAAEVVEAMKNYGKYATSKEDKANLEQLTALWQDYTKLHDTIGSLYAAGGQEAVLKMLEKDSRPTFVDGFMPLLEKMVKWNAAEAARLTAVTKAESRQGNMALLATVSVVSLLLLAAAGFITREVSRSLNQLTSAFEKLVNSDLRNMREGLQAFGRGDLSYMVKATCEPLPVESRDEFGKLTLSFNQMQDHIGACVGAYDETVRNLQSVIHHVQLGAEEVTASSGLLETSTTEANHAASEVALGAEQLAQSASDTSSAVQRLQAALGKVLAQAEHQVEISALASDTLRESAKSSELASKVASEMANSATAGATSAQSTVKAIESLEKHAESSAACVQELAEKGQRIGQIVQTIESIAHQTNLLALNAAIEAARAAESGRGFAVVADEVRKLAVASADATSEIGGLIGEVRDTITKAVQSVNSVLNEANVGATRSREAGETLDALKGEAQTVAAKLQSLQQVIEGLGDSIESVREGASSNSGLVLEIQQDVSVVSDTVDQFAAISHESAASADELRSLATQTAATGAELSALARELTDSVSQFKLSADENPKLRLAA